jgi:hypothetical protein
MKRIPVLTVLAAASLGVFGLTGTAGLAQTPVPQQQAPNMPMPRDMPAEKVDPKPIDRTEPSTTGSTENLSEKLNRTDGVIRPPASATPDMRVPAPVPEPNTTPVIPAPGSPGGNPLVQPK